MGTISDKLTYLNETKLLLKKAINDLGGDLTEESTFRSYTDALDTIYNEYPKVSDEGTEITLENTNKGRIEISQKGQTSQDSTTGKNLLNNTATNRITHGLTITVNEDKTITINGTADANVEIAIASVTLPVGTYIFSGLTNSTTDYAYINFSGIVNVYNGEQGRTLTEEKTTDVRLLLFNGKTYNNLTIYPMIRLVSATDDTYEPFTNGPAPNPDYPYPIKKVTGDNNVKVQNKNLFNKNTVTQGKWLNINGELENAGNYVVSDFIELIEGETYYIPKRQTTRTKYYKSDKSVYSNVWDVSDNAQAITIPSGVKYIRFSILVAGTGAIDLNTFQFEKGSTATTYVEHQEQNFPLTLGDLEVYEDGEFIKTSGKNLLPKATTSETKNGLTFTANEDGSIKVSGTATATTYYNLTKQTLQAGTYTLSGGVNSNCKIISKYGSSYQTSQGTGATFTLSEETTPTEFYIQITNGTSITTPIIFYPMISTNGGDYEPYGTDEWYLKNYWRKLELAIDDMNNNDAYPGWLNQTQMKDDFPNVNNSLGSVTNYYCNIGTKSGTSMQTNPVAINTVTQSTIMLAKQYFNLTQTEWKTNYPDLIFELVYLLATPSFTKVTSQTLTEQLNNLKNNAKSYKDVTYITQTNDDLPFNITASGLKKGSE